MIHQFLVTTFSIISLSTFMPTFAYAEESSCAVHVAVSSPVPLEHSVAFNVTNEDGLSKSIILGGGSGPKTIENLLCSRAPYSISATEFFNSSYLKTKTNPAIGQCKLRAGNVILNGTNNSVTVVFPQDFICN